RAWGLTIRTVGSLADVLPIHDTPARGALFMMDRTTLPASALLQSLYPGAQLDVQADPQPRTWWVDRWLPLTRTPDPPEPNAAFFPVSRQAAEAIRGVMVTVLAADDTPLVVQTDAQLDVLGAGELSHGAPLAGALPAARALLSGALYVPADGE